MAIINKVPFANIPGYPKFNTQSPTWQGVAKKAEENDYWNTDPDVLKFRELYRNKYGEEPSRDPKVAKYDYDAAYKSGVRPVLNNEDGLYHWDSKFKSDDHPNRYVDGIDTKTGVPLKSVSLEKEQPSSIFENSLQKFENNLLSTIASPVKKNTPEERNAILNQEGQFEDVTEFKPNFNKTEVDALKESVDNKLNIGKPSTLQTTNIISGINTAANVINNIVGAVTASKMKPTLIGYRAPVEVKTISDNTEQVKAGAQEQIDREIAGVRDVNRRYGKSVTGELLSKSLAAENDLSSKLAQTRLGIEAQNAQMENQMGQYNDQAERNRDASNAQIQTQFDIQKSGIISNAMQGISGALTGGMQSIIDNTMYGKSMEYATYKNELNSIDEEMKSSSSDLIRYNRLKDRREKLQEKFNDFISKTYKV